MPSLPSQSSHEHRGLLSILMAFFSGALAVSLWSRRHTPDREALDSKYAQDSTGAQRKSRQYVSPSPLRVVVEPLPPTAATPTEQWVSEKKKDRRSQWWMFGANVVTFLAVVWYAFVATQQRNEMIRQNNLTDQALRLNRKMLIATQAAGFTCQFNQNIGTQMTIQISCANRGKSGASNVTGEIAFTRSERGRIIQQEKRPINERIIVEGDGISRFFFVTDRYSWEWMLRQDMTGSVHLSYGNGIENVSQSSCWKLLIRPSERSTTFVDCENYAETKKTAK
jgi:hypothetical protein